MTYDKQYLNNVQKMILPLIDAAKRVMSQIHSILQCDSLSAAVGREIKAFGVGRMWCVLEKNDEIKSGA